MGSCLNPNTELHRKLVALYGRTRANFLYAAFYDAPFREKFGDFTKKGERTGILNNENEPKLFQDGKRLYVVSKDRVRYHLDDLTMRKIAHAKRHSIEDEIRRRLEVIEERAKKIATNLDLSIADITKKTIGIFGTNILSEKGFNWNSLKSGAKKINEKNIFTASHSDAETAFRMVFDSVTTRAQRTKLYAEMLPLMYKDRTFEKNYKPTEEEINQMLTTLSIKYVAWKMDKAAKEGVLTPQTKELYINLEQVISDIRVYGTLFDSLFNSILQGDFTMGFAPTSMDIGIAKSAIEIAKRFKLGNEEISETISRFKLLNDQFKIFMNANMHNLFNFDGRAYGITTNEALQVTKAQVEKSMLEHSVRFLNKYGYSVTEAINDYDNLPKEAKQLVENYHRVLKLYENFNAVAKLNFPRIGTKVKTREMEQFEEAAKLADIEPAVDIPALEKDAEAVEEENAYSEADVTTGIVQETQSSETFDGEKNATDLVKIFTNSVERIRQQDGKWVNDGGFVSSHYTYFRLLNVLSRLEIKDSWYGSIGIGMVRQKLGELFGKVTNSDAFNNPEDEYIFNALASLISKMSTPYLIRNHYTGATTDTTKTVPSGEFLSRNAYKASGVRYTRRRNEDTYRFIYRLEQETGHSNREIAIAWQRMYSRDIWNTLLSHFGSMEKSNFKFIATENNGGYYTYKYAPSASQGISDANKENIYSSITEAVLNEVINKKERSSKGIKQSNDDLLLTMMKKVNGEQASEFDVVTNFLRGIGQDGLASQLREDNPGISRIYEALVKGKVRVSDTEGTKPLFKVIESKFEEFRVKRAEYDRKIDAYHALTEEEAKEVSALVFRYREQQKRKNKKEPEYDKSLEVDIEEKDKVASRQEALRQEKIRKKMERAEKEGREYVEPVDLVLEDLIGKNDEERKENKELFNRKIVFDYYEAVDKMPVLSIKKELRQLVEAYDDALSNDTTLQRATSVLSKKVRKYMFTFGSNAQRNFNRYFKHGDFSMFKTDYYLKGNLYASGKLKVREWEDYDYMRRKNTYGKEYFKDYKDETVIDYFDRIFNAYFINNINQARYSNEYTITIGRIISNKPKPYSINVDFIMPDKVEGFIADTINQMLMRDVNNANRIKNFDPNNTVLFKVLDRHLEKRGMTLFGTDKTKSLKDAKNREEIIKEISSAIYKEDFKKMAQELTDAFFDFKVPLNKDLVTQQTQAIFDRELYPKTNLSSLITNERNESRLFSRTDNSFLIEKEDLMPLMHIFVANNYLHTYHLTQLDVGDPAYTKDSGKTIKRAAGPNAPGMMPSVNNWGMKPVTRIYIGRDLKEDINVLRKELEDIASKTDKLTKKQIDELVGNKFASSTDIADGSLFYTPEFGDELLKGFGESYGLSDVIKPAWTGFDNRDVPGMIKAAGFELTDEFCDAVDENNNLVYPGLHNLRHNIRMLGGEAFVVESAYKYGQTKKMLDTENLLSGKLQKGEQGNLFYTSADGTTIAEDYENTYKDMYNKDLRLQFNPYHSLDNSVLNPSQLSFFANVFEGNIKEADAIYNAIANIYRAQLGQLTSLTNTQIIEKLKNSVKSKGNERTQEFLEAGVSPGNPSIEKDAFTKIAALFKKTVLEVRYTNSQKLTARAPIGLKEDLKCDIIERSDGTKEYIAEVRIPRGVYPKFIEKMIEKRIKEGTNVFNTAGDSLIFRIPTSELHSAVTIKVVGFFEPGINHYGEVMDSTQIMVPSLLMKVMGFDFDIDSFFMINRQYVKKGGKPYYPGYSKDLKSFDFNNEYNMEKVASDEDYREEYLAYQRNVVLENFIRIVSKEDNLFRMLTPISFKLLENDIARLAEITDVDTLTYELGNPMEGWKAYASSFSGVTGTGATANSIKALAQTIRSGKTIEYEELSEERIKYLEKVGKEHRWLSEGDIRHLDMFLKETGAEVLDKSDKEKTEIAKAFRIYRKNNPLPSVMSAPTIRYGKDEKRLEYNGRTLSEIKQYTDEHKGVPKQSVWEILDSLVNAFIDNVNLQIMPRLNVSRPTFKAYIAGTALGVDYQTMNDLMAQPVLKHLAYTGRMSDSTGLSEKFGEALKDEENLTIDKDELEEALKYAKGKEMTLDKILAIGVPGEGASQDAIQAHRFAVTQLRALRIFRKLDDLGGDISTISQYLKILKDFDVTIEGIERFMDIRAKVINEDGTVNQNFKFNIDGLFDMNPHIKLADETLLALRDSAGGLLMMNSPKMVNFIRGIRDSLKTNKDKETMYALIKEELQKYIMSSIDTPHSSWDPDFRGYQNIPEIISKAQKPTKHYGKKAYMEHVANMVRLLKNFRGFTDANGRTDPTDSTAGNNFLKFVNVDPGYEMSIIRMIGTTNMNFMDFVELRTGFKQLRKFDYDFQTKKLIPYEGEGFSPVQLALFRYAVNQYGIKYGSRNFSLVFPPELYQPHDRAYQEELTKLLSYNNLQLIERDFVIQMGLAKGDMINEVPYTDDKDFEGYNASTNTFHDLRVFAGDGESWKNNIVRVDNTIYIKVFQDEEMGSFYQKAGRVPINYYYETPLEYTMAENNFRNDIYHTINNTPLTRIKWREGLEVGTLVSSSAPTDPSRQNVIYYTVSKVEGDWAILQRLEEFRRRSGTLPLAGLNHYH